MLNLMRTGIAVFLVVSSARSFAAPDRGKVIFTRLCAQCHGDKGEGNQALGAPLIAGLPQWFIEAQIAKFQSGGRGTHPNDIGGMRMRPMSLTIKTNEDLTHTSAYVAALPRPASVATVKGSAVRGEEKYKVCQACHGPDAKGNQVLSAPPLAGASDWYLVGQLKNFRAGIRGGNATKDPTGATMRGMASTLDEQGDLDVVSYINMLTP